MFNELKFKLGSLCKRGHDYEGTGKSLRNINTNNCLECSIEYRNEHKDEAKEYSKKYIQTNIERLKAYKGEWYKDNKSDINEQRRIRYNEDINFKILCNTRTRINATLRGKNKSSHTIELIGKSIEDYHNYLESTFYDDIRWDNYGTYWHIDHIIPLCSFDLTDPKQQKLAFNWSNTRAFKAIDNRNKISYDMNMRRRT